MPDTRTPIDPQGQHGLEHLLGINGIQNNPDRVNLDTIIPVVDMSMGGHARLNDGPNLMYNMQSKQLAAPGSSMSEWIVSYGNHQAVLNNDLVFRHGHNLRVIALSYLIHIPDAGVGVNYLLNRTYAVQIGMRSGVNEAPIWTATHEIYQQPSNAAPVRNNHYYNYPGDCATNQDALLPAGGFSDAVNRRMSDNHIRCPIIPSGWGLYFSMFTNSWPIPDASEYDFPAGTVMYIRMLAQQVPVGAPIPSYWE